MARNTTDTEWQILNVLTCNRCNLKTSDAALLQAHHCKPRNQQITAGVSYNLVNAKFTCSLCPGELPETEFCEHLECHLTLKPYVCMYCAKDFPTRDAICEHLRSFHQQDEQTCVLKLHGRTREIIQKARNHGKEFYKPVNVLVPKSNSAEVVINKTTIQNLTPVPGPRQKKLKSPVSSYSPLSDLGSTTVRNTVPTTISPVSSYSPLSGLGSTTVRNTVPTTISPVSSYSPHSGLGSTTVRNTVPTTISPVSSYSPLSGLGSKTVRNTVPTTISPVSSYSPLSGLGSTTVRNTVPTTISPVSSYSPLSGLGSTTVRNTVPTTISPVSSYSPLSGLGSTTVRNTVPTTISPVSSYSPFSGLGSKTVRNTVPTTISPVSSYSPLSGLGSTTVRNTVPATISPVSSYSPHSGLGSKTVRNTVPTSISPVSSYSPLSGLGPTTVCNTVPTKISPVSFGTHPQVSQLNSNTVLASARPQLPAEQRRMFVVLTTQPQIGSQPTLSTNALQTQAPSYLSQNVCAPASATSWRYPFAQKLPGQIIVPYVNNVSMFLQGLQAQRGGIQKPATTLPNLVTHSLHPTAPSITQNINTRGGVHIVTHLSPSSANQVKNPPALTEPHVFHLNQSYLSAPSVQNAPGTQMAATLTSSLVNNISASSAVTPNTHKAGNHLVPTVSPSHVNQPLAPAVIASTEGIRPLMSADVPVNCQSPTESDAGNMYKVSIRQFPTEVKSSVESDHVNGDFAGNLQINIEASSSATEVIHEHSSAAVIKSEESRDGDTDCPLQIRIENIMSLSTCQGDFQQCVQDKATDTIASTESSLTETGSNTTEHQFKTVESSNFSFLHVVKGCFLCSVCHMKWYADYDSFFKHIWEKHTHEADFSCCPTGYSPYCARLEAIVKTIYDKSQEPMSDQIRSYFTPKSCIETENEAVQNTSLSESSSSAPVSSRVETVTQINVSECPSSTVPVRPSSAARECEQILPAECVSRSSDSSSSLPTTLILDQHRQMIEIEQNYDFGPLPAVNELEKGAQDMQESAIQIEEQPTENQNISSSCELRDDQSFSHENVRIITAIDMSSTADSSSGNQKSYNKNISVDISDDNCDDINGHNRETGSVNYSLVDSLYSDELPLGLSKKTAQPEKLHNSVTATPLLAVEMAAGSSVTHIERVPPERIDNPHNSFTMTPLSAAETAVTSSVINCIHCASFFPNKPSWQKHMDVVHAEKPRMYRIQRKLLPYERKMHRHSNVSQQASQEDIPCLSNAERDAETTVQDYQCEGTNHKSHAMSGATANMLDETETDASNVIDNSKVCSKDVELTETHSHHEGRNVADSITAQTTRNISEIPKLLDLVKTSTAMKRLISAASLNTGKASDEQGAVANTEPNCIERRHSVAQEHCESGRCTTTINERRRSVDVDLHGLMRPVSSHGKNELREIVSEVTAIKASMGGNDGLMQIENSGNKEDYLQPVLNTSTSIDSRNRVKSALSRDEDIIRNTELDYEDQCCQEVVAEIPLGVQSSSHDNFSRTVSENISTSSYSITVPLNDHYLNEKSESCVVGQAEAIGEISKSRVEHDDSSSAVGNTDASSDLYQATSVESQDGCDVTSDSSSDKVSCKLQQTNDCSVGSNGYFNITPTALSLPVTRVSEFASIPAASFNLEMAETRAILCIPEQNKLEYTENTCLPVQDIGADIDNRQESRHSSLVLENNLRSGVQHDIEHGISNVVKDGEDQAPSVAVNGKSISRTVFLSSHTSTVVGHNNQEHRQTELLPSCHIHQADEAARMDSCVSVPSVADEPILNLPPVNRQKPTESLVFQQTVKGASVKNHNFESAHDSETNINDLLKESCINNRSHCTPDVSSVLKTVSHDSDDILNPATNSLGPDHDTCHDIDFSSSNDPACTLQESVCDFVGNVETLENDISCGHDILHHKTSSNLMQVIQAEKQETKKGVSCDEIHYNKNSLISTKGGQLYASNETLACIENTESRETHEENVLNSLSHSDNLMEENNTVSLGQTSIASNITENKDSSHTETNGLPDEISIEDDFGNSAFICMCATLNSCFADFDENVQPDDKPLNMSIIGKCVKCRLVTEKRSQENSESANSLTSKGSESLSEKTSAKCFQVLKRRAPLKLKNISKISRLENVSSHDIMGSKVDPPDNSTIKKHVQLGHSSICRPYTKPCVGSKKSKTNPAMNSVLETAADNGSTVLSESSPGTIDFTILDREIVSTKLDKCCRLDTKKDRDIFDSRCKKKPEAEPDEGIITSKRLRINSEKHNKSEDTGKQLDRSVAYSRSPKDIQEADVTAQVCRVSSDSSHKMVKKRKNEMYTCQRSQCNFTCIWDPEKMNKHISSKHPYYSCEYCEALYVTLESLYGHFKLMHSHMEPSVVDGTIALDRLFKRVDISYKGQSAEYKDITSQAPAKRKKRSQSSLRDGATKCKPKASSNRNVIETKRHTHLKRISPVSEHEVSSAEKPTVTSKTAAISNNGDSLSAKTERNLFKTTMSIKILQFDHAAFLDNQAAGSKVTSTVTEESNRKAEKYTSNNTISNKFAKTIDHTHRMPPTVSLHTTKTVANQPNATALLSSHSAENNISGNTVTEYQESDRHSSAQNVSSKIRSLGPMSSQNTVRKDNSSAATSNHCDINVRLNSATGVQFLSTIKNQELNSVDISDKQESSNRHGNAHETFPEMLCSETASCVSDTVSLHHTTTAASAIVTQDKKHCGTWMASQLETKTAAEGDENKNFVPGDLRTHSGKNLSMPNRSKTEFMGDNAATTHKKRHNVVSSKQLNQPFRCTDCSLIRKCVRDIEIHYNNDHAGKDVQLTERKSGFVYSNSGKCLRWKDGTNAPTDSELCSHCEFRSVERYDVEEHIRSGVHTERGVRVFSLCRPNTDRHSARSDLTSKVAALPHEASRSNSRTPYSYFYNVRNDVKSSESQFRLHLASQKSNSDFAQHTGEKISERRFKCFMCEHDSHLKIRVRVHIKNVHKIIVDNDVGIIDRDEQRNVDSRPIDPKVILNDPFKQQPNYLRELLLAYGIKTLDNCPDILPSEQDVYRTCFAIE